MTATFTSLQFSSATRAVPSDDDRLSATFAALANSTRRAILARLTTGAASVNELAEPFDMQLPAISKHLKVLERAGLVTRGRHAQYRPCALDAAPLAQVADWAEQYRPIWEARFDRLDDYIAQLQQRTPELTDAPAAVPADTDPPDPDPPNTDPPNTDRQQHD